MVKPVSKPEACRLMVQVIARYLDECRRAEHPPYHREVVERIYDALVERQWLEPGENAHAQTPRVQQTGQQPTSGRPTGPTQYRR